MTARAKSGYSIVKLRDVVPFKFSGKVRTAIAAEIQRYEKPDDVERAVSNLEGICSVMYPWQRLERAPSVKERKAGLRKASKLSDELRRAIEHDGLFGADWFEVQAQFNKRAGSDLRDLTQRLFFLAHSCAAVEPSVRRPDEPLVAEPFDQAADFIGMFYVRTLLTLPTVTKTCSYQEVVRLCCEELRGKRTTAGQIRRHAAHFAALYRSSQHKSRAKAPKN